MGGGGGGAYETGSLKTVDQNGVPSRNPVFCAVSGHVFSKICTFRSPPKRKHFSVS